MRWSYTAVATCRCIVPWVMIGATVAWDRASWSPTPTWQRTHTYEVVTAAVGVVVAGNVAVIMVDIGIVYVDAEAPAAVVEDDRTVEVVVGHETIPDGHAEKALDGTVTLVAYSHIVVIAVAHCHVIEVVIDTTDIIEVDTEEVIDEVDGCDAECVCHAVGEEAGIVAH